MAPRLAHTKSRNGCLRCKQRKVKCDENRPTCLSCSRHHVKCQYPTKSLTTNKSPTTDSEPDLDKLLTPEQRRHLELQLLHYFGSTMVWTLGSSTSLLGRETWAHTAIEFSFKFPFLQTAIYAFAALYILRSTAQSRRFFAPVEMQQAAARAVSRKVEVQCPLPMSTVHELYLDLGLRQQREAVDHLDAESVNAVFLSTLLFWYQAAPQVASEMPEGGYAPPLRWLRMAQANRDIAQLCKKMSPNGCVIDQIAGEDGPSFDDLDDLYGMQNCKPFEELINWKLYPEPEPFSPETKTIYEVWLAYVGSIHKAMQRNDPPRRVFRRLLCLGVMLPVEIVTLLEERRPRALAIMAAFSAMAYSLDDHWMWHGFADQEVEGIESIMPKDWMWAMEWPRRTLQELKDRPYGMRFSTC